MDHQKAIAALRNVSGTCNAVRAALIAPAPASTLAPELSALQADLRSILALIYSSVTKIALSLKPSSPTYSASLTPLQSLSDQCSALLHCTNLFRASNYGAILAKEVSQTAHNVIEAVDSLTSTLVTLETTSGHRSTGIAGDEYMVRTAAIHEIIDKAKAPTGLSLDNISAIRKIWLLDTESFDDAVREVGEIVDATDQDESDENDGWDEAGLDFGSALDATETDRAKKVQTLLRLSAVLHRRVHRDLLTSDGALQSTSLDSLPEHSSALLATADDIASALYPPQDFNAILADAERFMQNMTLLKDVLYSHSFPQQSLTEQLAELSVTEGAVSGRKLWFDRCFEQINKAAESVRQTPG